MNKTQVAQSVEDKKNKLQVDESKVEEKTDENDIIAKNSSDQKHATKFICWRLIKEVIVQPRTKGMFLLIFSQKQKWFKIVEYANIPCENF